jgi:hypothetical protein
MAYGMMLIEAEDMRIQQLLNTGCDVHAKTKVKNLSIILFSILF